MANVASVSQLMETVGVPMAQTNTPAASSENTQSFATVMQQANTDAGVPAPANQQEQQAQPKTSGNESEAAGGTANEQASATTENTSSNQIPKSAVSSVTVAPQPSIASRYTSENMLSALLGRATNAVIANAANQTPAQSDTTVLPQAIPTATGTPAAPLAASSAPIQISQAASPAQTPKTNAAAPAPTIATAQSATSTSAKLTAKEATTHSTARVTAKLATAPTSAPSALTPAAPLQNAVTSPVAAQQPSADLASLTVPPLPLAASVTSGSIPTVASVSAPPATPTIVSSTAGRAAQPILTSNAVGSAAPTRNVVRGNNQPAKLSAAPSPAGSVPLSTSNAALLTQSATPASVADAKPALYSTTFVAQAGTVGLVGPAAAAIVSDASPKAPTNSFSAQPNNLLATSIQAPTAAAPLVSSAIQQTAPAPSPSTTPVASPSKNPTRPSAIAAATTIPTTTTPSAQTAAVQSAAAKETHPLAVAAPAQPIAAVPADPSATAPTPVLATHAPVAVTSLSNANGPALAPATNASAASHTTDTLPHTTLSSTPTSLEVGVSSGTHGWLKIRAELNASGTIDASLTGANAAASGRLRSDLPALSSFLQNERVALGSLNVTTTNNATGAATSALHAVASTLEPVSSFTRSAAEAVGATGTTVAADAGAAGGRAPQQQAQQGSAPAVDMIPVVEAADNRASALPIAPLYGGTNDLGGSGLLSEDGYGGGGSWLNVRA